MTWYVKIGQLVIGWVIAADREKALRHAYAKFPASELERYEVEPRRR